MTCVPLLSVLCFMKYRQHVAEKVSAYRRGYMEQEKICIYVGEGQETTMSVLGSAAGGR